MIKISIQSVKDSQSLIDFMFNNVLMRHGVLHIH